MSRQARGKEADGGVRLASGEVNLRMVLPLERPLITRKKFVAAHTHGNVIMLYMAECVLEEVSIVFD